MKLLYYHIKMNEKYEWLFLYILMIESEIQWINKKQVRTDSDDQKMRFIE